MCIALQASIPTVSAGSAALSRTPIPSMLEGGWDLLTGVMDEGLTSRVVPAGEWDDGPPFLSVRPFTTPSPLVGPGAPLFRTC